MKDKSVISFPFGRENYEVLQKILKEGGWWSNWEINPTQSYNTLVLKIYYDWDAFFMKEIDADLFIRTNGTCEEPKDHHIENLKPCPFCGGKTLVLFGIVDSKSCFAKCQRCHASGDIYPNEDDMIKAWNTRVSGECKPQRRTVTMPDGTVLPEPVREALNDGEDYWVVTFGYEDTMEFATETVSDCVWHGSEYDNLWLKQGLIHRTEEDAKAWSEYILKLTKGEQK